MWKVCAGTRSCPHSHLVEEQAVVPGGSGPLGRGRVKETGHRPTDCSLRWPLACGHTHRSPGGTPSGGTRPQCVHLCTSGELCTHFKLPLHTSEGGPAVASLAHREVTAPYSVGQAEQGLEQVLGGPGRSHRPWSCSESPSPCAQVARSPPSSPCQRPGQGMAPNLLGGGAPREAAVPARGHGARNGSALWRQGGP